MPSCHETTAALCTIVDRDAGNSNAAVAAVTAPRNAIDLTPRSFGYATSCVAEIDRFWADSMAARGFRCNQVPGVGSHPLGLCRRLFLDLRKLRGRQTRQQVDQRPIAQDDEAFLRLQTFYGVFDRLCIIELGF